MIMDHLVVNPAIGKKDATGQTEQRKVDKQVMIHCTHSKSLASPLTFFKNPQSTRSFAQGRSQRGTVGAMPPPLTAHQNFLFNIQFNSIYLYKEDIINFLSYLFIYVFQTTKSNKTNRIKYFDPSKLVCLPYQDIFSEILDFTNLCIYVSLYFIFY